MNWQTSKNVTYVRSFMGFTSYYRRFIEGVNTQNVPRLWKGRSRGNIRTTLDFISYLIQSERDLSLFTEFSYSRYSYQRNSEGHISEQNKFVFINFGGTIMEETIGKWIKKLGLKLVAEGRKSKGLWREARQTPFPQSGGISKLIRRQKETSHQKDHLTRVNSARLQKKRL